MSLRVSAIAALACLAALTAPAAAARPHARAVLVGCEHGPTDADRAAVFEAHMRTLPGAARMQMRFALQVRTPDHPMWSRLAAPGFGTWTTSAAGMARYVYTKRVENLVA